MTTPSGFGALPAPAHWQVVDFIADLHLKPEEPQTFKVWASYMRATRADAVVILGDLFEAWIGDDMATPGSFEAACTKVLQDCRADLAFMRGNRDFLVGDALLDSVGMLDLALDPTVFKIGSQRFLLSHGDLLCIDDLPYQAFRQQARAPEWQQAFLAKPLAERQAIGRQMREHSEASQRGLDPSEYAEADAALSRQWLLQSGASTLIHGHTHRPADHGLEPEADGQPLTRVVLSDWHVTDATRRAEVLRLHAQDGRLTRIDPSEA